VVVQFEDFETAKAVPLLNKYRHEYRCFNDDIQGTGCVTLAGILSAARIVGTPMTELRILCAGMGSAGQGVCGQLMEGMIAAGLSREEAKKRFLLCSVDGAFGKKDGKHGNPHDQQLAKGTLTEAAMIWRNECISDGSSMLEAIKEFKPTVILGLSATGGVFSEPIVREMAKHCERPIIMPMSNPTTKAECTAQQAYEWTDGKAIVASGSPFGPVTLADGRVFNPSQCNNMYIFPGIGLAVSVGGISSITDKMLYTAALACAQSTSAEDIAAGRIFPTLNNIRNVSFNVAVAVIEEGIKEGLATKITKKHLQEGIPSLVKRKSYYPVYVPLL